MKCKRCQEPFSFWKWLFHNCRTYTINSSGILRVDVKKLVNSDKFKKDCNDDRKVLESLIDQLNKRRSGSYIPETRDERVYKDVKKYIENTSVPRWHDKAFESFLDELEKVLDEKDKAKPIPPPERIVKEGKQPDKDSETEQRLNNLTAKEIVDVTIEFCKWLDKQGWSRVDTFFGEHNDEIKKKERELFWWRYPPYSKIKAFKLKKKS